MYIAIFSFLVVLSFLIGAQTITTIQQVWAGAQTYINLALPIGWVILGIILIAFLLVFTVKISKK